jgi:hypothetical protein
LCEGLPERRIEFLADVRFAVENVFCLWKFFQKITASLRYMSAEICNQDKDGDDRT